MSDWRERAGTRFECEKRPATGSRAMAVTNHPLASAAALEMFAAGGNAVDAAVAAMFTLCVVEPMMVGLLGGGTTHVRTPQGRHFVLDGLCRAPAAARPDMFEPLAVERFAFADVRDRRNALGAEALAVPGIPAMLCEAASRFARLPLAALVEPAARHAANGFPITPYLADSIASGTEEIALDAPLAAQLMPGGTPLAAGDRLVQAELALTLRAIAARGEAAFREGDIPRKLASYVAAKGGHLAERDLRDYGVVVRDAVRGTYRGHEIFGAPPPVSSGVHVAQMLNLLEGYDIARMGFGTSATLHLVAEALKIAFADRSAATADPAFFPVPVERLISKGYADSRRAQVDAGRARSWSAGVAMSEAAHTTHVTLADAEGWVVSATHSIGPGNFGAGFLVPELGLVANNYMGDFDPRPGRPQSIAPGKRPTSSQSPMIVARDGVAAFALGLPGGLRIFGSAMQSILNLVDHGMTLQEAVEAPRLWTRGFEVELEPAFPPSVIASLSRLGHEVVGVPNVAGGMNAVALAADGIEGAACWRADGAPAGLGGGNARAGITANARARSVTRYP